MSNSSHRAQSGLDEPVDQRRRWSLGDLPSAVTEAICRPSSSGCRRAGTGFFGVSLAICSGCWCSPRLALLGGHGIWGLNNPVGWGWAIVNFVFWVGIGHAGTLISAILFLFRQKWRTSINRFAEAMTIFAVICALLFPGIHVGRIWVRTGCSRYPNQMGMWPNFRSPLLWDVFAVSTYGTVSLLFWYVGLIPDLATLRDRAKSSWPRCLRHLRAGLARIGEPTGSTTRRPT
jgi:Ni/Fe-hydrogenase subunit HybB-like protein